METQKIKRQQVAFFYWKEEKRKVKRNTIACFRRKMRIIGCESTNPINKSYKNSFKTGKQIFVGYVNGFVD
jgi:hypothetical protein